MNARVRPLGISLLSILAAAGIVGSAVFYLPRLKAEPFVLAVVVLVAAVYLAILVGLYLGNRYCYAVVLCTAGIALLRGLLGVFVPDPRYGPVASGVRACIMALWLLYLTRPAVRAFFASIPRVTGSAPFDDGA
jgi:hypothetical protein